MENEEMRGRSHRAQRHGLRPWAMLAVAMAFLGQGSDRAWAHCDSLDGPVARDARVALDKGDPTAVLKWVRKEDEGEIRQAFQLALAVRAKGADAKTLADRYFLENLVRIHRAGEGEGFTGLKPAGSVDPGIAAADEALRSGSATELARRLAASIEDGVKTRFALAFERSKHSTESVEAGRNFVEAYVDYIHFAERVDELSRHGAPHTHTEPAAHTQ